MAWPPPVDFRDAVQNPQQCFEAHDLACQRRRVNGQQGAAEALHWPGYPQTAEGTVVTRARCGQLLDQSVG